MMNGLWFEEREKVNSVTFSWVRCTLIQENVTACLSRSNTDIKVYWKNKRQIKKRLSLIAAYRLIRQSLTVIVFRALSNALNWTRALNINMSIQLQYSDDWRTGHIASLDWKYVCFLFGLVSIRGKHNLFSSQQRVALGAAHYSYCGWGSS